MMAEREVVNIRRKWWSFMMILYAGLWGGVWWFNARGPAKAWVGFKGEVFRGRLKNENSTEDPRKAVLYVSVVKDCE